MTKSLSSTRVGLHCRLKKQRDYMLRVGSQVTQVRIINSKGENWGNGKIRIFTSKNIQISLEKNEFRFAKTCDENKSSELFGVNFHCYLTT